MLGAGGGRGWGVWVDGWGAWLALVFLSLLESCGRGGGGKGRGRGKVRDMQPRESVECRVGGSRGGGG